MAGARRVVIVGAGVTGLLTALGCARAGHRVTVVDRGPIPNPVSSSWDQHRALRALAPADPAGTRAAATLHDRWLALETLLGARFYRRVGVVTAWPTDQVDTALTAAEDAGLPVTRFEPAKLPHIVFPPGSTGLLEMDAGVLLADRVLRAAARLLAAHPAVTLRPEQDVTEVDIDTARVTLADGTTLPADLVLLATGPWSADLVDLSMVLHRQTMLYLRPPADLTGWWRDAPSAGAVGTDGRAWLLPPGEGTMLKISHASACREVDRVADDPDEPWIDRIMAAGILTAPDRYTLAGTKTCHYQVDGGGLVRLGPAVWVRTAGGDGFRTAPLVADQIVQALGQDSDRRECA